jgi:hypothetical protein
VAGGAMLLGSAIDGQALTAEDLAMSQWTYFGEWCITNLDIYKITKKNQIKR